MNANGLNYSLKGNNCWKDKKRKDPTMGYLWEMNLSSKDTYRLKIKRQKTIFHSNKKQKQAEVAVLISDKTLFKSEQY